MSAAPTGEEDEAAAAGIARLEGYLLIQAETQAACMAAEDFARRLPGLSREQREEVVRHYTADRMALTRRTLEHLTDRSGELRAEYTERYALLRRRLVGATCLVLVAGSAYVWAAVRLAS